MKKREELLNTVKSFLPKEDQLKYGVIIRTNAAQASKDELLFELIQLEKEVERSISGSKHLN